MVCLEKQTEILRRENVVDLSTNGMDGIIWEQTGRQGESRRPNWNLAAETEPRLGPFGLEHARHERHRSREMDP